MVDIPSGLSLVRGPVQMIEMMSTRNVCLLTCEDGLGTARLVGSPISIEIDVSQGPFVPQGCGNIDIVIHDDETDATEHHRLGPHDRRGTMTVIYLQPWQWEGLLF